MRDRRTLESVERMVKTYSAWQLYKAEALEQLDRKQQSINRVIHLTRSPVDPIEVEYYRGFRQGVMYALEGLPNELIDHALPKLLAEIAKESDSS